MCHVRDYQNLTFRRTGASEANLNSLKAVLSQASGAIQSDDGKKLAYMNNRTHMALWQVSSTYSVSYTALINADTLAKAMSATNSDRHRKGHATPPACSLDLLIFTSRDDADSVARILAKYMLFLQHPHPYSTILPYENPQYLDVPGGSLSAGSMLPPLSQGVIETFEALEAGQSEKNRSSGTTDPSRLLDDLAIPEGIKAIDIDDRIKPTLFRSVKFVGIDINPWLGLTFPHTEI